MGSGSGRDGVEGKGRRGLLNNFFGLNVHVAARCCTVMNV